MYTDADRTRDEYQVKQNKAIAQLVVDYALKTESRIAGLEATLAVAVEKGSSLTLDDVREAARAGSAEGSASALDARIADARVELDVTEG